MVWWACFAPVARAAAGAASVCAARKLMLCAPQRAVLGLASPFLGACRGVFVSWKKRVRSERCAECCRKCCARRVACLRWHTDCQRACLCAAARLLVRSRQCTSFVRRRGQRGLCGISGRPVLVILGGRGVPFVRAGGFVALCGRAGNVRGDRSLVGRSTVGAKVKVRFASRCALGVPCLFLCAVVGASLVWACGAGHGLLSWGRTGTQKTVRALCR